MEKKAAWIKRLRAAVSLVLVALYAAGLIAMFASSVQTGLILWVVSTLGGIGLLYWIYTVEKRQAEPENTEGAKPDSEPKATEGTEE